MLYYNSIYLIMFRANYNQVGDSFVSKKLDRALSNLEWL
jgi:hypothetical protein